MKCKCYADNTTGEIKYCPLHATAPDMYEALKEAKKIINKCVPRDKNTPYMGKERDMLAKINKALNKAGGKE